MSAGRLAEIIGRKLDNANSISQVVNHFHEDDALSVLMSDGSVYLVRIEASTSLDSPRCHFHPGRLCDSKTCSCDHAGEV